LRDFKLLLLFFHLVLGTIISKSPLNLRKGFLNDKYWGENLFVGELEFFGLVGILTSKFNSRRIFEFGDLKVSPP
jgi:hypothetical protein